MPAAHMAMKRVRVTAAMVGSLCAAATPALAEGAPPAAIPDPTVARPAFAMMDNTGDGSMVQMDVAMSFLGDSGSDAHAQLWRPRLLAQYIDPAGIGGYITYGGAGITGDDIDGTFKLGNLELGGLFQRSITPEFDVGFRAGLTFHTADDDDAVNAIALAITRPSDLALAAPDSWLRLGVSPSLHSGMVFGRVDLGVDFQLDHDNRQRLGHVNAALGIGQAAWSVAGELGIEFPLSGDSDGDDTLKIIALSARYNAGPVSPFLAISYPMDVGDFGNVINVLAGLTLPIAI